MKKFKIDKYLLMCILLTIVGYGIIFFVNGIYPFGNRIINLLDFDSGYIPVYYKLWDVLHFKSSALFDWNLGSGLNAFGSLIGNGFISPLCWIIALFSRDSIPYTISYVYLIKLVFISIMTYVAIGKIFPKTEGPYKVLFTMIYTFSCYLFIMSTNLLYLDSIAIYPLLVYSLKELLEKGHWKLYTFLLTITLLMSYYIAWLDLLFIIGTTGFALLFMKTDNKKEKAVKVLVCTLFSLLMSCVLFLPGFMFARTSARMANNTSTDGIFAFFIEKSSYLFTLAIPLVLTIKQLFIKKDKNYNKFIIAMLLMLLLGVFIEPINALWHTGSHSGFPLRYGYQIIFFMSLVSIYYINNNYKPVKKSNYQFIIIPAFILANLVAIFFITRKAIYYENFFASGDIKVLAYLVLLFIFFIDIACYFLILKNDKKKCILLTTIFMIIQSLSFGYLYIQFLPVQTSVAMQNIVNKFNLINDGYNYSVYVNYSNVNYPYILNVPSIENRIHFIRQNEIDQVKYLGFNWKDTFVYSYGGNHFTNALMQNKYYLSSYEYNNNLFDLINTSDDIYYYKSKESLSYLIPYNGNDYNEEEINFYINSNKIYKELFDGEKELYTLINSKKNDNEIIFKTEKGKIYNILVQFDESNLNEIIDSGLYASLDFSFNKNELSYYNAVLYDDFRENISFESNVDGEIVLGLPNVKMDYDIYEFNYDEFKKFINNYGNLDVEVTTDGTTKTYLYEAKEDGSVLLPINYTDEYEIRVNGEKVDYKCNLYNMLSIDLKKGNNKIEVEFKHKWFKLGIIISIISVSILIILDLINKRFKFLSKKIILYPLFLISCLAFMAFIIKIYIFSLF